MIIEDDELLLAQLGRRFRQAGYEVDLAEDGAVAMDRFWAQRPDVVVTDIVMPNREGIETIRELRRVAPQLPIVAMSAGVRGAQDCLRIAELMGAQVVFPKPFDINSMLEAIAGLVEAVRPGR